MKNHVISNTVLIEMKYNQTITFENEKSDFLYIIKSGCVRILKNHNNDLIQIIDLPQNNVFGEESYLKQKNNFTICC